jgi:predicted Zn-dependent peptidase
MKIVSSNGGQNNANTTQDRTFYYEVFPSNQLKQDYGWKAKDVTPGYQ